MELLLSAAVFLGYFVLVLGAATVCGMLGYYIGSAIGSVVAFAIQPIVGRCTALMIATLFGVTGYVLGCIAGAVFTLYQISRKASATGAEGDVVTEGSKDTSSGGPAPAGDEV